MLLTSDTVTPSQFAEHTGWVVKPQGACKGDVCVPLPAQARHEDGTLNAGVIAERLGMPRVHEKARGLSSLGPESAVTGRMLTTAQAPELELPTFDGGSFSLSSLRGS